jgi:CelD/BcsL family acetyltransferase involved in cellulose biosynthesis
LERPGNVYTRDDFITLLGEAFHPGRVCRAAEVAVGRDVYRLLRVQGSGWAPETTFVDYHEPVGRLEGWAAWSPWPRGPQGRRLRRLPRLRKASVGLVPVADHLAEGEHAAALGAPVVVWEGFENWESYLALLRSRRTLAEDLRRRRRLEDVAGPLRFTVDDLADDVLPTCFAWKTGRDREAGRPELFAEAAPRRFFEALRARGLLRASTLRGDGRLLSVWLGSVHEGRWSGWVFAFNPDPALARCSPGRQLLYPMLQESWRAGHREFDFSIGLEPYKLSFATHVRVLGTAGSPPLDERLAAVARRLLGRHPWALQVLRGLRRGRPVWPSRPQLPTEP